MNRRRSSNFVFLCPSQFISKIGDLKLSKELKAKLLGSDREGLGIGLGLGIMIADLKLSILAPVKFRSPI